MSMQTDHIFMIFLCRLCFPARWNDLKKIVGGSWSTLSLAYNWALKYVYWKYVPLVEDIHIWKRFFSTFASRLDQMGAPYDNLIAFFNGHFYETLQQGGDACVLGNLKDYQTHSFLHGTHGYMYQACVLVNGMSMCWGPYLGKDHDAKTFVWTDILNDLASIEAEIGIVFPVFVDSAYPR
mmetsp:Transcript_69794/g.145537  ORF Transcript_69794/g.145537 Transcript_69794/m.145537 type:complete len:180 (-) Transcript_69794:194-733(-)